ncbi:MAG: undecaprenyl-diphosphatase UppP [Flavobacteriales bacterium]|tara:strand:- start:4251 stop:5042 length:792 start_codon:yes stop_codon:yes gene_type:complete
MDYFEAFLLGVVQGLTEFLPISSSGHIEISKVILGSSFDKNEGLLFTIILHFATALSTMFIFRKDIINIFKGLLTKKWNESKKFSLSILISMIPAVFIGLLYEDFINSLFNGNLILVAAMLYITGLLLFLSDFLKLKKKEITYKNSFIIGLAQAIAILPGISRSGATIATSVIMGIDREKAARFSFIMVIPLIFGSMFKSMIDYDFNFESFNIISLLIGFISAFITGLFACKWMIRLVKSSKLYYFSIYCWIVGSIIVAYSLN